MRYRQRVRSRDKYCWFFVSQSHRTSSSHAAHDRASRHSVGRNSLFFSNCLCRSSHVLADLAVFSRTKRDKEGIGAKPNSRADSALAAAGAAVSSHDLRGNYLREMIQPTLLASVYIRKHARAYSVHCAANALDEMDPTRCRFFLFVDGHRTHTVCRQN